MGLTSPVPLRTLATFWVWTISAAHKKFGLSVWPGSEGSSFFNWRCVFCGGYLILERGSQYVQREVLLSDCLGLLLLVVRELLDVQPTSTRGESFLRGPTFGLPLRRYQPRVP